MCGLTGLGTLAVVAVRTWVGCFPIQRLAILLSSLPFTSSPCFTSCVHPPVRLPGPFSLKELEDVAWRTYQWWLADDAADGARLQLALEALTALTGLHLRGVVAKVPNTAAALQNCGQLQWLCDTRYDPFGAEAWPEQLRCARLTWPQVLQAPWSASCAQRLRYLRISANAYEDRIIWSQATSQPAWMAFWGWAATAHDLRLLEVNTGVVVVVVVGEACGSCEWPTVVPCTALTCACLLAVSQPRRPPVPQQWQ